MNESLLQEDQPPRSALGSAEPFFQPNSGESDTKEEEHKVQFLIFTANVRNTAIVTAESPVVKWDAICIFYQTITRVGYRGFCSHRNRIDGWDRNNRFHLVPTGNLMDSHIKAWATWFINAMLRKEPCQMRFVSDGTDQGVAHRQKLEASPLPTLSSKFPLSPDSW